MEKLLSIIVELDKALEKLTKTKALSREEFLNNPVVVDSTKYNFMVAIEAVIDVCNIDGVLLRDMPMYADWQAGRPNFLRSL